jgi:hypothetical protein
MSQVYATNSTPDLNSLPPTQAMCIQTCEDYQALFEFQRMIGELVGMDAVKFLTCGGHHADGG